MARIYAVEGPPSQRNTGYMAIETSPRVPPSVALRQEIERQRRTLPFFAQAYRPVLDLLDAYVAETDARIAALEGQR